MNRTQQQKQIYYTLIRADPIKKKNKKIKKQITCRFKNK